MTGNGGDDMGGTMNPVDMAHGTTNKDFSTTNPPDLTMPTTGGMTGCNGLLNCLNTCAQTDQTCINNCFNNTTAQGQSLFTTAQMCVQTNCPSTNTTDPCYDPMSTTCNTCINTACMSQVNACLNSTP
jgi:hypothetical protein